jgi:hypothetical protein
MDIFRWFRHNKQPATLNKEVRGAMGRMFEREKEFQRGKQLTNEAISHGTLGNNAKALSLIDDAILQHRYAPAMTVKAKLLIAADRSREADEWLRNCLVRLANKSETQFDGFPKGALMVEMYEQLGVIQFRSYGNLPEAVKLFQMGLDIEQTSLPAEQLEQLRHTTYEQLAHLYAIEGLPEEAVRYCKKRLTSSTGCGFCERILKMMHGFERRPFNLQTVVDGMVEQLVSLGHAQALQIPNPVCTSSVYDSIVPIAFAWVCMQHKVKPNNFLSGPEVSLLTDRASLMMAGSRRLGSEKVAKDMRPFTSEMIGQGFRFTFGKDEKAVLADCRERLGNIMSAIPVDDLFDGNDYAMSCLASWGAENLKLTPEQSIRLVDSLSRA